MWNGSTPTVLDFPAGFIAGDANAVNSNGLVVGSIYLRDLEPEPVVWHGTTPTLLPVTKPTQGGAPAGKALAVSNLSLVVGNATVATGYDHAAAWRNGVVTDLGTLSIGTRSSAVAVNTRGIIVGESTLADGPDSHAVLWSSSGAEPQDLNSLISAAQAAQYVLAAATGINNSCTIVANGYNRKTKVQEAFLLTLIDSRGIRWVLCELTGSQRTVCYESSNTRWSGIHASRRRGTIGGGSLLCPVAYLLRAGAAQYLEPRISRPIPYRLRHQQCRRGGRSGWWCLRLRARMPGYLAQRHTDCSCLGARHHRRSSNRDQQLRSGYRLHDRE